MAPPILHLSCLQSHSCDNLLILLVNLRYTLTHTLCILCAYPRKITFPGSYFWGIVNPFIGGFLLLDEFGFPNMEPLQGGVVTSGHFSYHFSVMKEVSLSGAYNSQSCFFSNSLNVLLFLNFFCKQISPLYYSSTSSRFLWYRQNETRLLTKILHKWPNPLLDWIHILIWKHMSHATIVFVSLIIFPSFHQHGLLTLSSSI